MKQWSSFFQNPEFLEKTRMYILNEDVRDLVTEKLNLRPGMKVLDIGCGTGAFTRYLARSSKAVTFTGLDLDPDFVKEANRLIPDDSSCTFDFIQGDATSLPFEANSFDAVVSHTFFNSMPRYREALREMIRVCRENGTIASMTSMDPLHVPYFGGIYPKDADSWKKDYDRLLEKVYGMYERIAPLRDYLQGIPTTCIPNLFESEHLHQISAWPFGRFFSLSNSAVPEDTKRRYIELSYLSDLKHLNAVYEEPEAKALMTDHEVENFRELLKQKHDYLLRHLSDNRAWEWEGGTSLLVTGKKPAKDESLMDDIRSILHCSGGIG